MGIWEKCKVSGTEPGDRIEVDAAGSSWIRFLSESFRHHDTADFGYLGDGIDLIFGGVETPGGGGEAVLMPGTLISGF